LISFARQTRVGILVGHVCGLVFTPASESDLKGYLDLAVVLLEIFSSHVLHVVIVFHCLKNLGGVNFCEVFHCT